MEKKLAEEFEYISAIQDATLKAEEQILTTDQRKKHQWLKEETKMSPINVRGAIKSGAGF